MQIGIGFPGTIPGMSGATLLVWARRADAGPFSSLSIIDRLVYSNFDSMITLAVGQKITGAPACHSRSVAASLTSSWRQ